MRNDKDGKLYDIFPALQQLRGEGEHHDSAADAELKRQVAINAADPRAVALYADIAGDDWAHLYPPAPAPSQPDTDSAIDIFLDTYGAGAPGEAALIERMIFNPTPEYLLADNSDTEATDDLDALIGTITEPAPNPRPQVTPARSSSLSESLAKSYIRQGRYRRAYEIISELNLNNPEKSVYFADQLRFLQKLMALQEARNNGNPTAD